MRAERVSRLDIDSLCSTILSDPFMSSAHPPRQERVEVPQLYSIAIRIHYDLAITHHPPSVFDLSRILLIRFGLFFLLMQLSMRNVMRAASLAIT